MQPTYDQNHFTSLIPNPKRGARPAVAQCLWAFKPHPPRAFRRWSLLPSWPAVLANFDMQDMYVPFSLFFFFSPLNIEFDQIFLEETLTDTGLIPCQFSSLKALGCSESCSIMSQDDLDMSQYVLQGGSYKQAIEEGFDLLHLQ